MGVVLWNQKGILLVVFLLYKTIKVLKQVYSVNKSRPSETATCCYYLILSFIMYLLSCCISLLCKNGIAIMALLLNQFNLWVEMPLLSHKQARILLFTTPINFCVIGLILCILALSNLQRLKTLGVFLKIFTIHL